MTSAVPHLQSTSASKSTNVRSAARAAGGALAALAYRSASWVAPESTQRKLALRFFTPPPPRPVSAIASSVLARADDRFPVRVQSPELFRFAWPGHAPEVERGRRVWVTLWGRGPAVYLLHGWGGRGAQWTSFVDPLVRAGHTVVVLDAPAHGDSPGRWSSIPQFAAALIAACDGVGPAHSLVGHSLGGAALSWALRHGLSSPRAVLIGAPADPSAFFDDFARRAPLRARLRGSLRHNAERALGLSFDDLPVRAPTACETRALIVHDRNDRHVPYDDSARIARAWPGAHVAGTSGLGHFGILQSTEVVERTLAFVRDRG